MEEYKQLLRTLPFDNVSAYLIFDQACNQNIDHVLAMGISSLLGWQRMVSPQVVVEVTTAAGLDVAIVLALGLAVLLRVLRLLRKQPWKYAFGGLLAVGLG